MTPSTHSSTPSPAQTDLAPHADQRLGFCMLCHQFCLYVEGSKGNYGWSECLVEWVTRGGRDEVYINKHAGVGVVLHNGAHPRVGIDGLPWEVARPKYSSHNHVFATGLGSG